MKHINLPRSLMQESLLLSPEDEDLRKLSRFEGIYGYASIFKDGKAIMLHHLIIKRMGLRVPEGYVRDHINQIKLDNRRENLRVVKHKENLANNSALGVSFCNRAKKWRAYVKRDYKYIHLGYFKTKDEALTARQNYLDKEGLNVRAS